MSSFAAAFLVIGILVVGGYFCVKYLVFEGESFASVFRAIFPSHDSRSAPISTQEDRDFGKIRYIAPSTSTGFGYWQMDDSWKDTKLSSASIPGDTTGPYEKERRFVLEKFASAQVIFCQFRSDLIDTARQLYPRLTEDNVEEIFFLSCINTDRILDDSSQWELCFEALPPHRWSCISLQIQANKVVSNSIDT